MSGHINPYYRPQGLMSLKISSFIDGDIDFKYMFYGNQMRCQKEPMFKWLVDTRKVLTVNTADKDWGYIKNKRRDKSWINDDFSYWASPSRYFVIGYAIESCKGNGAGLSVNLDKIVEIFSNKEKHQELIENFVNDFFYSSSIDIYSTKACKNSMLVEHKSLTSCFENGYRLCADLYVALDQAKKMGPIGSFMKLSNVCLALGFDELPLWYIQESLEHGLNAYISKDVELQKSLAVWGFVRNGQNAMMVATNDPYGMKDSRSDLDNQSSSQGSVVSLSSVQGSKGGSPRATGVKKEAKPRAETKPLASVESLLVDDEVSVQTIQTAATQEVALDTEIDSVNALDTEVDEVSGVEVAETQEVAEEPARKPSKKGQRLLAMF